MSIKSKKMDLKKFEAIKEFACEFGNEITTISGENGTGKSTIVDAFMWVLFGKDSHGRSDFEVDEIPVKQKEYQAAI